MVFLGGWAFRMSEVPLYLLQDWVTVSFEYAETFTHSSMERLVLIPVWRGLHSFQYGETLAHSSIERRLQGYLNHKKTPFPRTLP